MEHFSQEVPILTPTQIAEIFLESFDGSAVELFRQYLSRHANVRKWIISADFVLRDSARPMDCFAFTIFPYDAWPADMERETNRVLPRDLKQAKSLDRTAIEWLRDGRRFHIVITINKDRTPFSNGSGTIPLRIAREHIAQTIDQLRDCDSEMDMANRFKKLMQKAQAKSFKVNLLGDIGLLAIWFAAITIITARERECKIIGWFPDRDKMTDWCDGIWRDYGWCNLQAFAEAFDVDLGTTAICMAEADDTGSPEIMWFDYLIRPADWFAGALAAWARKLNLLPSHHPKYLQMINDVVLGAQNVIVLHCDIKENRAQFRRVTATN